MKYAHLRDRQYGHINPEMQMQIRTQVKVHLERFFASFFFYLKKCPLTVGHCIISGLVVSGEAAWFA